ncbi:class I tRNA ligase family protein [Candidatus Wolfebacteria bacterium]|nr:class I tRNA ligase family protein [Candidatus Wolfebacteria bacterium]
MSNEPKNTSISEMEEKILKLWNEKKIFEKSVEKPKSYKLKAKGDYVFYDGPPFATGTPHYGHILASIIKDAIPRYQTMKGKRVERKWGWDCHGLPIENLIEQDLNLKTRKDIEKYGIENFNDAARKKVLTYVDDWKKAIPRIGRWVDMENSYKTMDTDYTESIWWAFKNLFDKKLAYEGYKSMHICPRCETTLSNFEVAQGYKDIEDASVILKFPISNSQFPNTYLLVWTTTPWTLPGNVALAVNDKIIYVKIQNDNSKLKNSECYILAKDRLAEIFKNEEYKIVEEFKGKDLIGLNYEPLFNYYSHDKKLENRERGWKVYGADFVSTSEGTGIVHIAPAFGADDMDLGKKYNLPFIQHVGMDGKFRKEVKDPKAQQVGYGASFAGLSVKPKDNPQSTDQLIISWLKKNNKLFKSEKSIHSYPHCWRCETPLLNYAASSWFIKVAAIKKELIENNKKIKWVPGHIKEGRFGKILEDAPDWAVSRSRYWGAPLPVWQCQGTRIHADKNADSRGCGKIKIIGSLQELKDISKKSGNDYFLMRHGEALSNKKNIVSFNKKTSNKYPLTDKGKREVIATAKKIKEIDFIFSSDFFRTKQTAELIAETINFNKKKIIFDKRLGELNAGFFDGQKIEKYLNYFSSYEERFVKTPPNGENFTELKNRVSEFLYEIEKKYKNKKILIVGHEVPLYLMAAGAIGADVKKTLEMKKSALDDFISFAEIKKLEFSPLPHNQNYELDLHRPYIDKVEFSCLCGGVMKRVEYVFDCWFESGAMPFASAHYPFVKNLRFPAEFIAEGIDQTRGWFYTLHVLGTALFGKSAFKHVIANGIVLAEDGQKMSKRLKNYPDPMDMVNKYGADALRYYLLSSPVMRAEDLNFSEKAVDEIYKKVILRLMNVLSFYELYASKKVKSQKLKVKSFNVLDQWILARLNELEKEITKAMDSYELDKATRPIADFVDDLSTWYIRRSRERFKKIGVRNEKLEMRDGQAAAETTKFVLLEFSKIIAPFMPFVAEEIYQELRGGKESVHLEKWPAAGSVNINLLAAMSFVRSFASMALMQRARHNIKVRQPLQKLSIKHTGKAPPHWNKVKNILASEVNVKEIVLDTTMSQNDPPVKLDITITHKLKNEGVARDFIRIVQDLRKKSGYTPQNKIYLWLEVPEVIKSAINANLKDFKEKIGAKSVEFKRVKKFDAESKTSFENHKIWIGIKKD